MKNKICDKLISLLLVLILVVVSMGYTVLYSFAGDILADGVHSFYVGKIKPKSVIAEFNEDFSELTVFVTSAKSDGYMKDWTSPDSENYTYNPVYEHRDTLTKVIITDGVANTGDFLCYDCSQLKSVVLPKSVVRIGNSSFRKTGVTAISFPSKLVYIGERAFSGCHSLNGDLIIPDSVKAIGDYAFFNCYSLSGRLILGSSVKSLGRFAFDRCFDSEGTM